MHIRHLDSNQTLFLFVQVSLFIFRKESVIRWMVTYILSWYLSPFWTLMCFVPSKVTMTKCCIKAYMLSRQGCCVIFHRQIFHLNSFISCKIFCLFKYWQAFPVSQELPQKNSEQTKLWEMRFLFVWEQHNFPSCLELWWRQLQAAFYGSNIKGLISVSDRTSALAVLGFPILQMSESPFQELRSNYTITALFFVSFFFTTFSWKDLPAFERTVISLGAVVHFLNLLCHSLIT